MKYVKKQTDVEVITFDELITHGKNQIKESDLVNNMPWSFDYFGHNITHENDKCYLIPTSDDIVKMTPDDVLIMGESGEIYPCNIDVFESTYELSDLKYGLNFGLAIEALKQGKLVQRAGWNGKGMFVMKQIPAEIELDIIPKMQSVQESAKQKLIESGNTLKYQNQMLIIKPDGTADSWIPSSSDVFAEDWLIVE